MPRPYCTRDDVRTFLPSNVVFEGENPSPDFYNTNPENTKGIDVDFYIVQASQFIDSSLGTMYDVPLKKVNQGGEVGYPAPIPLCAAAMAAQMIYAKDLQGADRQSSEEQKHRMDAAIAHFSSIQNGESRLAGIRATRGSRFTNNNLFDAPRNPAEGRRTKGSS